VHINTLKKRKRKEEAIFQEKKAGISVERHAGGVYMGRREGGKKKKKALQHKRPSLPKIGDQGVEAGPRRFGRLEELNGKKKREKRAHSCLRKGTSAVLGGRGRPRIGRGKGAVIKVIRMYNIDAVPEGDYYHEQPV